MALSIRILTFLGLTATLSVAQDVDLIIEPRGETHTRALGASVVFTCTATGLSNEVDPRLEWYDQENRSVTERTGRMYIEQDHHALKMYISSIEARDAGKYTCRGVLEGNRMERHVTLLLFKDITFVHAPRLQHPVINRDELINCSVSGQPIPTVSWRYRGQKIIHGQRYQYEEHGLRIRGVTEDDNGMYTCRAEVASDGRLKEVVIEVSVIIPPTITKQVGEAEGIEEQEVSLTCHAVGKPDPKYRFYKYNSDVPIEVQPSERIQIDRDAGAINFRPLRKSDEGKYLCEAINTAGDAKTEGFLKVIVPPKIIELKNVTEQEGNTQTLRCKTKGDPEPLITFQKVGTQRPYEDGDNEGGRIFVQKVETNTMDLTIKSLTPDDTSNYTCRATNMGGEHAQNGTITVEFEPRFSPDHPKLFYAWAGKIRNMTCHALGEPEPVVDWYLHDLDRPLENNGSYKVFKMGRTSVLQVLVRDEDVGWIYGDYRCKAVNKHGSGHTEIELRKATMPGKPRSAEVKDQSPTMVILTVQAPDYNGGIEIYGYRVEYESRSQDFKTGEEIRIENLRPSTVYIFRIRAKNEVGVGSYLEYTLTTEAIRSPYQINIISDPEGEEPYAFVVRWDIPKTGGLPIKEYQFKYRTVEVKDNTWELKKPLTDWVKLQVADDPNKPRYFYKLTQLQPNSYYEVEVMARNDIGRSAPNPQYIFRTADGVYLESTTTAGGHGNTGIIPITTKDGKPVSVVGSAPKWVGSVLCFILASVAAVLLA